MLLAAHAEAQTTNTAIFQLGNDDVQTAQLILGNSTPMVNGNMTVQQGTEDSLLRFDLSSLEGQYTQIESITLTLNVSASVSSGVFAVSALSTVDGTWGTTALTEPNWNYQRAASSTPWAGSPGAEKYGVDYTSQLADAFWNTGQTSSVYTLNFSGSPTALTSLVNSWNSSTNAGLLITSLTNTISSGDLSFYAGPGATAALTPELTVTYESVSVPEPDALLLFGMSMLVVIAYVKCRKRTEA